MSFNPVRGTREKRQYYASSQGPFHNASNIHMFYGGGDRGPILDTIIRSLRVDDRLVTVHGERGSGKTMLSLVLADRLQQRYNLLRYDHPMVSQALILRHLLIELCPQDADLITSTQAAEGADAGSIEVATQRIEQALQAPPPAGKPFIFIVDSQSRVCPATQRLLHALAAVRRAEGPAMHVVLLQSVDADAARAIGAHNAVNHPENHYWLRRLTLAEIHEYAGHHMLLYDYNRRDMFTREMAYFIADRSEGVFRAINTLARNAFTLAGLEDADRLSMSHLLMAGLPASAEECEPTRFTSRHRRFVIALVGFCVVVSIGAMVTFV